MIEAMTGSSHRFGDGFGCGTDSEGCSIADGETLPKTRWAAGYDLSDEGLIQWR